MKARYFLLISFIIAILAGSAVKLNADEVNSNNHKIYLTLASFADHHIESALPWNEGFDNSAKGIEYLYVLTENISVGGTYMKFENSYFTDTLVKGFVFEYRKPLIKDLEAHLKLFVLYQKGYKRWQIYGATSNKYDDTFWTPMISYGITYKWFFIEGVHSSETLTAIRGGLVARF